MSERPEESSRQMDSRDGEHASVTVTEVSEESMHSAAARTIDQEALRKLKNRTVAIKKSVADTHYEVTTPLGSRLSLPDSFDKSSLYTALQKFNADASQETMFVQVDNPSVSYFVHHAAMVAGLLPSPPISEAFSLSAHDALAKVTRINPAVKNTTVLSLCTNNNKGINNSNNNNGAFSSSSIVFHTYPTLIGLSKGHENELAALRDVIASFAAEEEMKEAFSQLNPYPSATLPSAPSSSSSSASAPVARSLSSSPTIASLGGSVSTVVPAGAKLDLPPSSAPLRYAARVIARDFGLVGLSEGVGAGRHAVVWRTPERNYLDSKLRAFANSSSSTNQDEALQLPPMDGELRRFTAVAAADLGLYARSVGSGKDRHTVVYRRLPVVDEQSERAYLSSLFQQLPRRADGALHLEDVEDAVRSLGLPAALVEDTLDYIKRRVSPTSAASASSSSSSSSSSSPGAAGSPSEQQVVRLTEEDFISLMQSKERDLRALFNAFDTKRTGVIRFEDVDKVIQAADLVTSIRDDAVLSAFIDRARRAGDKGLNYNEFRTFFSLTSPTALAHVGEEFLRATSSGFHQRKAATTKKSSSSAWFALWSSLAGGIANAFSRTVVAPLERLRLQMSVDHVHYPTIGVSVKKIVEQEGVSGLWRGNVLNVIRIAPQGAISFLTKDWVRDVLPESLRHSASGLAIASMASGAICMTAVYPLDMIRGRMTVSRGLYPSWYAGIAQVYKQEGLRGLFKGGTHSASWATAYYGVQFFSYDSVKAILVNHRKAQGKSPTIDSATSLALGAFSGVLCVTASYPMELIRRKIQVQGMGGRPVLYNSWMDCAKKVVANEGGYKGFYKGLGANLLKTPPSVALTFGAYEFLMNNVFHVKK